MKTFFDILIAIGIVITALPAVILLCELRKEDTWEIKHKKWTIALAAVILLGTVTIIYGSFIEPKFLVINKQEIDMPGITQPIKIAFVSDFQVGPYIKKGCVEKAVKKIITLEPDLILLGGDHIDNGGAMEDETKYLAPLAKLPKYAPTYAIHGNHEYGVGNDLMVAFENKRMPDINREMERVMSEMEIDYLTNELRALSIKGQKLYLFGGDSSEALKLNFSELKNRNLEIPTIALLHDPRDVITASSHNINVMLSGHTHGGQIRLPFLGPLGRIDSYTTLAWYKGWNEYNGTKFFVTSGIGETGARTRLFNPPEIVLITLK